MSSAAEMPSQKASVRQICGRLHQAYRGLRLYPPDHPTARRTLTDFFDVLSSHLDRFGPIMLRITETELLFEDEEVYTYEDARGNLAFLMFRDGLRFLAFHPGIEESEVEGFVACLAKSDDLASVEYDLPAALWERDFLHLEYEVVGSLGSGVGQLRDAALNDLRETVLKRLSELNPGAGTGGGPESSDSAGSGEGAGIEVTADSVAVSQEDLERTEWAVSELKDPLGDFAVVLLEVAGAPAVDEGGEATLARSLSFVAERYLTQVDLGGLELMVDRIAGLVAAGRRPPEFATKVFGEAATTERLEQVIGLVGQGSPEQVARVEALLGKLRDWVLPTLLEILAESSDKSIRKTALALLEAEGGVPLVYLWPLMEDPRWYVVRNAVGLATGSGDPALVDHLEPLVRHSDARVRREAVRSLDTIDSQKPAGLLAGALTDQDPSVRVLAAHALARRGNRSHLGAVEAQVEARDFPTRPAEEIAALLAAYAALGGEASVAVLNKLWKRKLFGTKPLPVRLGAIQALALIATPSALEALSQAATAGDTQIKRAAARARAEARPKTKGEAG